MSIGLGILDALGGFSGGLAQALNQQQGDSDLGAALSALAGVQSGGPMSGGAPIPPVSGSGQGVGGGYQGQTNLNLPTATQQPQAGPGIGAGPLAAQVSAASPQPPVASTAAQNGGNYGYAAAPPQSQPQGSNLPSPVGQTNQSQGAPPMPQGQGASASIGRGPLTLTSLVSAIKQHNPNISNAHLSQAIRKAIPLLSMEGLQQYRSLGLQLREEQMQNLQADRQDRSADRKQGMRDRLQMANDRIQAQSERQQKELEIKNENIKVRLQALQQAKTFKEAKMNADALRSAIRDKLTAAKDKLEATNHQIQMQYGLDDNAKAELYKQAQADYAESEKAAKVASDNLDKMLAQKKEGKTNSETSKGNVQGAQGKASPKISDQQKATYKSQAEAAIKAGKDPAWIKNKYKELTGEDLGD